jgi:hypothetical protein
VPSTSASTASTTLLAPPTSASTASKNLPAPTTPESTASNEAAPSRAVPLVSNQNRRQQIPLNQSPSGDFKEPSEDDDSSSISSSNSSSPQNSFEALFLPNGVPTAFQAQVSELGALMLRQPSASVQHQLNASRICIPLLLIGAPLTEIQRFSTFTVDECKLLLHVLETVPDITLEVLDRVLSVCFDGPRPDPHQYFERIRPHIPTWRKVLQPSRAVVLLSVEKQKLLSQQSSFVTLKPSHVSAVVKEIAALPDTREMSKTTLSLLQRTYDNLSKAKQHHAALSMGNFAKLTPRGTSELLGMSSSNNLKSSQRKPPKFVSASSSVPERLLTGTQLPPHILSNPVLMRAKNPDEDFTLATWMLAESGVDAVFNGSNTSLGADFLYYFKLTERFQCFMLEFLTLVAEEVVKVLPTNTHFSQLLSKFKSIGAGGLENSLNDKDVFDPFTLAAIDSGASSLTVGSQAFEALTATISQNPSLSDYSLIRDCLNFRLDPTLPVLNQLSLNDALFERGRLETQSSSDTSAPHPAVSKSEELVLWVTALSDQNYRSKLNASDSNILDRLLRSYRQKLAFNLEGSSSSTSFFLDDPQAVLDIFEALEADSKFIGTSQNELSGHAMTLQQSKQLAAQQAASAAAALAQKQQTSKPPSKPPAGPPAKSKPNNPKKKPPTSEGTSHPPSKDEHFESQQDKQAKRLKTYPSKVASLVTVLKACGISVKDYLVNVNLNGVMTMRWIRGSRVDLKGPLEIHKDLAYQVIYATHRTSENYVGPSLEKAPTLNEEVKGKQGHAHAAQQQQQFNQQQPPPQQPQPPQQQQQFNQLQPPPQQSQPQQQHQQFNQLQPLLQQPLSQPQQPQFNQQQQQQQQQFSQYPQYPPVQPQGFAASFLSSSNAPNVSHSFFPPSNNNHPDMSHVQRGQYNPMGGGKTSLFHGGGPFNGSGGGGFSDGSGGGSPFNSSGGGRRHEGSRGGGHSDGSGGGGHFNESTGGYNGAAQQHEDDRGTSGGSFF